MKSRWVIVTCGLAIGLGSVGCKGDDAGGKSFDACGGEVAGVWQVVGGNLDRDDPDARLELDPACNDKFDSITVNGPGTVFTFGETGSVTTTGSTEAVFTYRYTAACLRAVSGGAVSEANAEVCKGIATALQTGVQTEAPQNSARCAVGGSDCDCTLHLFEQYPSGTYTAEDGILTVNGDPSEYCVDGDTLLVHDASGTFELMRLE